MFRLTDIDRFRCIIRGMTMDTNEELYAALIKKRDELRESGKVVGGRRPRVCTDEACVEMVRLRPQKIADFGMISGIGDTFMERYAEYSLSLRRFFAVLIDAIELMESL